MEHDPTGHGPAPAPRDVVPHSVSVVIPVYQGERTLPTLLEEITPLSEGVLSPAGRSVVVAEVLLVHDNGPDDSARVMRELAEAYPFVRPVWLSRNFGQHAATLAGMASSGGDWVATLDEDGQHDPASIPAMVDTAVEQQADVVYGKPVNPPPHGFARNLASRSAKILLRTSTGRQSATDFQSYRLVLGEVARSVAAYAGVGVYLDVAMGWVARRIATCPIELREEGDRPSGYSMRSLVSHFWRMVLSSGTRALRIVSLLGVVFAIGGFLLALYFLVARLVWGFEAPQGWPTIIVALLLIGGAVLFSLGVIAEYIGVAVNMAMGKPLYLIVSDAADGPLGRTETAHRESLEQRRVPDHPVTSPPPEPVRPAAVSRPGVPN
jgi:undecaprenyl-phosphate 4-deoxy-4-formamido-L-arabinose transferase